MSTNISSENYYMPQIYNVPEKSDSDLIVSYS